MRQDQAWVAQAIGKVYSVVSKAGVNIIGELKAVEEDDFVIDNAVLLIVQSVPQREAGTGRMLVSTETLFTQFPQLGFSPSPLRVAPSDWFEIPPNTRTMERYLQAKNASVEARSGIKLSGPGLHSV
jgi:hypothetical protein